MAVFASSFTAGSQTATTAGSSTTTATSYGNLADAVNTAVTVTIGPTGFAIVMVQASISQSLANDVAKFSYAVSGNTTVAASDTNSVHYQAYANNSINWMSGAWLVTGLTAGSNTFTIKYAVEVGGTGTFTNRQISVVPL